MDKQILCFKHCDTVIFCFDLPAVCPLCRLSISTLTLDGIPFRLPYPFVKAKQHACAIVMKSTTGTFLEHYDCNKDLHIGITDSLGSVYEYDSEGLQNQKTEEWTQSIVVYKIAEVWRSHWDNTLSLMYTNPKWHANNYNESSFNCYSFVIGFLRELNCKELNEFIDKETFCEKFILSKIVSTNEYITMYRNVKKDGYYIKKAKWIDEQK